MPMPVSVTSRRTTRPSRRALIVDSSARRRVLDGVIDQIGQHLTKTFGVGRNGQVCLDICGHVDVLVLGDVLVQLDDFTDKRRNRHGSYVQAHGPGLGFRDVHQRIEHREDPLGFLEARHQRLAMRLRIVGLQRPFGDTSQPRHRRPQIVRHVVEGVLHPLDQRGDPIEHLVEKRAELVDGIAFGADRDTGVDTTRCGRCRGRL